MAAEPLKDKAKEELVLPIAEMKLTNGRVWKNVSVVRYEKENVVLKSSAGIGPLPYTYVKEPTRGLMLAERDKVLKSAEQTRQATALAEAKFREDQNKKASAASAAAEARKARVSAAIRKNSIFVGMTPDEVKQSWGAPQKINASGGSYGTHEQWIYPNNYVYFRDGELSSWQDK